MPKVPSDKLFNLIKSMSASEKRHFHIFVNPTKDKNNKYMKLFKMIDRQTVFNDEKLQKKIYGKQKIESQKYSELKDYLYKQILKSLQGFDERTSVDYRLKNMLLSVRVLFKRSLYDDCIILLEKGKKLAEKYEQFNSILEILAWQKKIAYAQSDMEYIGKNLGEIATEEQRIQVKIENLNHYRNIFLKLLMTLRQNVIRREKIREKIQVIMDEPILKSEGFAQSNLAKILYNRIYAFYFYSLSDIQKYYSTNKYLLELMESMPHYLHEDLTEYIAVLSNFVVSCGNLGKYEEIEASLGKLIKLSPDTQENQTYVYRLYYERKLKLCIIKGEFEEGVKEIESISKVVPSTQQYIFENAGFYFNAFFVYFGVENYDEALNYLNNWLNMPKSDERQDLQSLAKILNMITHYEMNNPLLIESLIRSNTRYLSKQEGTHQLEEIMISFFSKICNSSKIPLTKQELLEVFRRLKEELENDLQTPEDKRLLNTFEIISWIKSKITNHTFSEIIKMKFQNNTDANFS